MRAFPADYKSALPCAHADIPSQAQLGAPSRSAELYSAGGELAKLPKAFSELQHFTRKTTTVKQSFRTNSQRQVVD